jgi:phosphoribosyl-ATP pyrophosphohydrolase/phosphoribosyl-AMP cyclohydrolase
MKVTMAIPIPDNLKYDANGLIPTLVQDFASGDILMVAFANAEAVGLTGATAIAHFWSRSRGKLWKKGETSGNVLRVREVRTDCDRDCLLLIVDPAGPACHTNERTCFGEATATAAGMGAALDAVIAARAEQRPAGSYTAQLLAGGLETTLGKLAEEAAELAAAARAESGDRVVSEAADLIYHVAVALQQRGASLTQVLAELKRRREQR